jgi:hypothetical protein
MARKPDEPLSPDTRAYIEHKFAEIERAVTWLDLADGMVDRMTAQGIRAKAREAYDALVHSILTMPMEAAQQARFDLLLAHVKARLDTAGA